MSADAVEVAPERLRGWLEQWASEHGGAVRTETRPGRVTFTGADGASVVCEPPFPPLAGPFGLADGFHPESLLAHAARERVVGVILVTLGGFAVGVFAGRRVVTSKTGARAKADRPGAQGQRRIERRRESDAQVAQDAAADVAAAVVLPYLADLDAVVLGGDRFALAAVLEDRRLRPLARLAGERVIDVPDARPAALKRTPDRFRATVLRVDRVNPGPSFSTAHASRPDRVARCSS